MASSGDGAKGSSGKKRRLPSAEASGDVSTAADAPEKQPKSKRKKAGDAVGDNDDGGAQQPKKKGRQPKKKVPAPEDSGISPSKVDAELAEECAILLQSTDVTLKESRRIAKAMKTATLKRVVSAVVTDESEVRSADLLHGPVIPGRNVVKTTFKSQEDGWVMSFEDRGTVKFMEAKRDIKVDFLHLPRDMDVATVKAFHAQLAKYHNTWPYGFPRTVGSISLVRHWIVNAYADMNPAEPPEIRGPEIQQRNYSVTIPYFDSDTGLPKTNLVRVVPTDAIAKDVEVPQLPGLYLRTQENKSTKSLSRVTANNPQYLGPTKGMINPTSVASQHKVQDALRYIATQLTGIVTTPARMDQLVSMYRQQLGLSPKPSTGLYGGEGPLYYVEQSRHTGQLWIRPSKAVRHDVLNPGIIKWDIRINSMNVTRAIAVLDMLIQKFCAGVDLRRVWLEAAKIGDVVNSAINEGHPASSRCDCDDQATGTELHACEGCTLETICRFRSFDNNGRLVCRKCAARDTLLVGRRTKIETLSQYLARVSLTRSFIVECASRNMTVTGAEEQRILNAACEDLKTLCSSFEPTEYECAYTIQTYDVGEERPLLGNNPSRRRVIPHGIVVDAVLPQGEPGWSDFKHSAGNLAIVTNACNYAKYVYLPGTIHVVGEYLRDKKQKPPSTQAKHQLFETLLDFTKVQLKRHYINKSKSAGTAEEKHRKIKAEMICGKPTPGETGPWEYQVLRFTSHQPPPVSKGKLWDDVTFARSQECAASIKDYFGVEVPKLNDGTYWPHNWHADETVDRNGIALLCCERLSRMRLSCNKKWETADSDEALYAEIIFQYCASTTTKPELQWLKQKYGDLLGLPLTMWTHSPLRFSVAHREHGFGMFTGWPLCPVDVSERIENDTKNNMLIESWYYNYTKQDFADDYVPEVQNILHNANLLQSSPRKYYDPSQQPPATVIPGLDTMELIERFDVDDGATFNSGDVDDDAAADTSRNMGDESSTAVAKGHVEPVVGGKFYKAGADDEHPDQGAEVSAQTMIDLSNRLVALRRIITEQPSQAAIFVNDGRVVEMLAALQGYADAGDESAFRVTDQDLVNILEPNEQA